MDLLIHLPKDMYLAITVSSSKSVEAVPLKRVNGCYLNIIRDNISVDLAVLDVCSPIMVPLLQIGMWKYCLAFIGSTM